VPGAKFATWLYTIANHVASNALRNQTRRREVNLQPRDTGSTSARPLDVMIQANSSFMPSRQLEKAERREVVQIALDSLNERQRMAVLLSKFEGMSYADIAAVMELTPQAIKSLLSRARGNLREVLEPYIENGERPTGEHTFEDDG
jgi:RNA polymerase sigma-70 factor, ECF subfamily